VQQGDMMTLAAVIEGLRERSDDVTVSILWLIAMMAAVYFYHHVSTPEPQPPVPKGGIKEPLVVFTEP